MKAMVLRNARQPLEFLEVPTPVPSEKQVLVKVLACAACRTELHVPDGGLLHPTPVLIPGHEIAGEVTAVGSEVTTLRAGDRVGIPWLGWICEYCLTGHENAVLVP